MLNFVLICTCCLWICSPIENIHNRMVWWWRKTENFWHSITLSVIYSHIGIQWMQLGDPTRVHCKNNIQNTIAKVNSSQFLVLDNFFRGHRTYFMCIYSAPRCATTVEVFTSIVFLQLYYSRWPTFGEPMIQYLVNLVSGGWK